MDLFKRNKKMTNRDRLLETMKLPKQIRAFPSEEKMKIMRKQIAEAKELLQNMVCENCTYELSKRQQRTNELAIIHIREKDYLEAYFEIIDFIDNYGDNHNGKVFEKEKQILYNLLTLFPTEEEITFTIDPTVHYISIYIWGHWVGGKPGDSYYSIDSIEYNKKTDTLVLYFGNTENGFLTFYHPIGIHYTRSEFYVMEASKIVWHYGVVSYDDPFKIDPAEKTYTYVDKTTVSVEYKGQVCNMKPEKNCAFALSL